MISTSPLRSFSYAPNHDLSLILILLLIRFHHEQINFRFSHSHFRGVSLDSSRLEIRLAVSFDELRYLTSFCGRGAVQISHDLKIVLISAKPFHLPFLSLTTQSRSAILGELYRHSLTLFTTTIRRQLTITLGRRQLHSTPFKK